ncbi:MAG TPA: flagellar brake protein [Armatimonadota bacterium]
MRAPKTSETIGQYLHLNDRLELLIDNHRYSSRVEGLHADTVEVAAPVSHGQAMVLRPGMALELRFKQTDGLYRFETQLLERLPGPPPVLVLGGLSNLRRAQRRLYARIQENVDFSLRSPRRPALLGRTETLGGGGLTFYHTEFRGLEPDTFVTLSLTLDSGGDTILCKARVVRVEGMLPVFRGYRIALAYTDIGEADRDRVLRYILTRQLQTRSGAVG